MLGGDAMTTVSSSPLELGECALVAELERERGLAFEDEGKLSAAVRKGDVGECRVSSNCGALVTGEWLALSAAETSLKSEILRPGLMERRLSCREVTDKVWDGKLPFPSAARLESERRSCFAGGVAERKISLPLRVLLSEMDGEGDGRVFDLAGGSRSSAL